MQYYSLVNHTHKYLLLSLIILFIGGIGCDLICMTRPPLHSVPLFCFRRDFLSDPHSFLHPPQILQPLYAPSSYQSINSNNNNNANSSTKKSKGKESINSQSDTNIAAKISITKPSTAITANKSSSSSAEINELDNSLDAYEIMQELWGGKVGSVYKAKRKRKQ